MLFSFHSLQQILSLSQRKCLIQHKYFSAKHALFLKSFLRPTSTITLAVRLIIVSISRFHAEFRYRMQSIQLCASHTHPPFNTRRNGEVFNNSRDICGAEHTAELRALFCRVPINIYAALRLHLKHVNLKRNFVKVSRGDFC